MSNNTDYTLNPRLSEYGSLNDSDFNKEIINTYKLND